MPPILLLATSLLLTFLPARFGHWILMASFASVLLCYPPRPAQIRLWWHLLLRPENLLAAAEADIGRPVETAEARQPRSEDSC